jgi:hypothetical protein
MVEKGKERMVITGDGFGYSVKAESKKGLKKIVLIRDSETGSQTLFDLTGYGKLDNPFITLHDHSLFVVWEIYEEISRLQFTRIELNDTLDGKRLNHSMPQWVSQKLDKQPSYRPRLCSNGRDLLLCYELFSHHEYKIVCQYWLSQFFSSIFEVGFDRGNNQEPWIEPLGDKEGFLLSYENSQPLYKDYVWISPSGNKVIIPGFGHGWRVETKSFLKKITLDDTGLLVSSLGSPMGEKGHILKDEEESSGCPRVIALDNSTFAVIFLAMGDHIWQVKYALFDGQNWLDSVDTGLKQDKRLTPWASYDKGKKVLTLRTENPQGGEKQVINVPLSDWLDSILGPDSQGNLVQAPFSEPVSCSYPEMAPKDFENKKIEYKGEMLKLLWGDLHMHSNLSKCSLHSKFHCVELEEKFRQSRDVGRLDFAMVTDHDSMTDSEWERTKEQADFHNRPGIFTAFQGFEWTATHGPEPKQGHYNVLYRDSGSLYRVSEEKGSHITKLWQQMTEGEVLTIPHHPADETHTLDWDFFDPRFEPLVEIFQVRGSYEYPGNSLDPSLFRPEKMVPGGTILDALERGYEFGFTSGGEHEGVGTTAVFALENTREAIFDALKKRQVYGTTGDHIFMDFRINGTLMGGVIHGLEGDPEVSMEIEGTAPIKELRIMRDGQKIYSRSFKEKSIKQTWTDRDYSSIKEERRTHYYYLVVEQENGEVGWASPVFIKG